MEWALTLGAAAAALIWILVEHRYLMRALGWAVAPVPEPARHPPLTVVRPVRGIDVEAEENVAALLGMQYRGALEILFIFDDAEDEAVPLYRRLVERHLADHPEARVRILYCGRPPAGRTGKLHAMGLGVREATGELIAFSDSDTRVPPDLVAALVRRLLGTPGAGDAFAPAIAVSRAQTWGDAGYAIMLNSWYGAVAAAAAGQQRELPFIMGQLMVFRREALDAIGGVECADGQLVDDMYLGTRVAAAGMHNVLAERVLPIITGGMAPSEFLRLMRRWVLFSRSGLPTTLKLPSWLRGVALWLAMASMVYALTQGWLVVAALGAAGVAAACISDRRLQVAIGGAALPLRWWWTTPAIALFGPWVVASMMLDHHLEWRGRDYELSGEARLAERNAK